MNEEYGILDYHNQYEDEWIFYTFDQGFSNGGAWIDILFPP